MRQRRIWEKIVPLALSIPASIVVLAFLVVVVVVGLRGIGVLSWEMVATSVYHGGIAEAVIGTLYLLVGAAIMAAVVGIATAVYLVEYAPGGRLSRIVTQALNNLAGVPTIIFGLFGAIFFCRILGLGVSLLSGWLILMCMMLPIVVRGSQEALRMVPKSFRDAAQALGASKWRTIRDVVLPTAAPGLATSVILGVSRVAGETAAILFVCSPVLAPLPKSPLEPTVALATYIWLVLMTQPDPERALALASAACLVLLVVVVLLNTVAYAIRVYYRRRWGRIGV